jgi:mutator protein MutT
LTRHVARINSGLVNRVEVAIAIIVRDGSVLICQRPRDGVLGGFWEFPGGKREPDESIDDCLRREIKEEVDLDVQIVAELSPIEHEYPHAHVTLYPRLCDIVSGVPHPHASEQLMWVRPIHLAGYHFPPANAPLLQWIVENVTPEEEPPPAQRRTDELDELRIRKIARLSQANMRWRSYCLVGAIACGLGAANLLWRAIVASRLLPTTLYLLAAIVMVWACFRLLRKARELDRRSPAQNTPTSPPDFSTLSDGSHVVKNLEDMGH